MIKCFTRESSDAHNSPFKNYLRKKKKLSKAVEKFDEIIVYNDSTEVWKRVNIKQTSIEHRKTKSTKIKNQRRNKNLRMMLEKVYK